MTKPNEYALERGWDFTCIEDTARLGVAEADYEGLTAAGISVEEMETWCREQVAK